jgi:TRAP-type C4-dicarboxylate transport system substrate-binding protein
VSAVAVAASIAGGVQAAEKLKFASYITPKHAVSVWLEKIWREIESKSNGALEVTTFFGGQLGPPPKYLDLVASGQVDVAWFLHGNFPGVFKLTEVSNLPYLMGSAEIGAKVMNDPALRDRYFDKEHLNQGIKVLNIHTHQPGSVFTARDPVRSVEDFKGLRIRFPSGPIKDMLVALGGTPTGLPPTDVVESFQKGTLDGTFIDYGGAAFAFHMGPVTKFTTEMYMYVGSFCVCMNQDSFDRLPANVQKLIDDTFAAQRVEPGIAFDRLDVPAKKLMIKQGTQVLEFPQAEEAKIRAVAAKISEQHLADLEKRGLPGREVYDTIKTLSAKYAPESRNFWKK